MDANDRTARALERIADALETIAGAVTAPGAQPQAQGETSTQAHGRLPTFQGYLCSWTKDARGFPSYIVTPDGEIADKRTSQDDVWYSTKTGEEFGPHLAKVRAGETLPPEAQWTPPAAQEVQSPVIQGNTTAAPSTPLPPAAEPEPSQAPAAPVNESTPAERPGEAQRRAAEQARAAAASPQPEPPDSENPFTALDNPTLRRLHALGRAVHGEQWREVGPARVLAHSDGRAERSEQLSHDEATRLINELTAAMETKAKGRTPEFAG